MDRICGLSAQIDPALTLNNLVVPLRYTELERSEISDAFSVSLFKHTSVVNGTRRLIPSHCAVGASVVAQCG